MPKRNKFSLSNYKLLTCNQGELVPCGLTEVLPGDTIQQATSMLLRVLPLNAPVMHPVHVRIHHWFVPHRLVWEDWEDFITGGPDGLNASAFPTVSLDPARGSLMDYLGVPPDGSAHTVSALPLRAYQLIWNEFYRDQDLHTAATIDLTDGVDSTTTQDMQNICWEKDYFTSSRGDTQKGDEVYLDIWPDGGRLDVKGIGIDTSVTTESSKSVRETGETSSTTFSTAVPSVDEDNIAEDIDSQIFVDRAGTGYPDIFAEIPAGGLGTEITVNELREKIALQKHAEFMQRFGSRYSEYLRAQGVRFSDGRLQRPEYLGGGRQTIQFSEVLQTATGGTYGVGGLAGHGIAALRSNRYRRYFEEHGYVISLLSVRPKTIYTQGIARTWNRRTKEDFYNMHLQHIGMQEILNKEIYAPHSTPDGTFGYQDRYDEYRRQESSVAGDFRNGGGLTEWHMGRIFDSDPALNDTFVECNPTNRIYSVTDRDQLWIMANHSIQARRLLHKSGAPGGL